MSIAEILRLFLFNHQRSGQVTVRKVVSRKPSSFQKEKTIRLEISEKGRPRFVQSISSSPICPVR
jgi:hypothetical protein